MICLPPRPTGGLAIHQAIYYTVVTVVPAMSRNEAPRRLTTIGPCEFAAYVFRDTAAHTTTFKWGKGRY